MEEQRVAGSASVREQGPWTHKNISAAGASFHVAIAGDGPHTVLFVHDFPLYWWSWRHQLPTIAAAGYRAVAVDLRGFGGSDYAPGNVDLARLATDVSAVAQALGAGSYTLVAAGMGAAPAWAAAHRKEEALKSLLLVGANHPRNAKARGPRRGPRQLQNGTLVGRLLEDWAAPQNAANILEQEPTYSAPMRRRFAADSAWETYEATRKLSFAQRKSVATKIPIPVWSVWGENDPHYTSGALAKDSDFVVDPIHHVEVANSGRWVSEEQPDDLSRTILEHLHEVGAPR